MAKKQAACKHNYIDKHGYCEKCKLQTRLSIAELESEKRRLYQENDNKKLDEVKKQLDFLYYGIK